MKKNRFLTRMTALLLVLVCMLGLLPTAALGGGRPQLYQAGGLHPQWRPL